MIGLPLQFVHKLISNHIRHLSHCWCIDKKSHYERTNEITITYCQSIWKTLIWDMTNLPSLHPSFLKITLYCIRDTITLIPLYLYLFFCIFRYIWWKTASQWWIMRRNDPFKSNMINNVSHIINKKKSI